MSRIAAHSSTRHCSDLGYCWPGLCNSPLSWSLSDNRACTHPQHILLSLLLTSGLFCFSIISLVTNSVLLSDHNTSLLSRPAAHLTFITDLACFDSHIIDLLTLYIWTYFMFPWLSCIFSSRAIPRTCGTWTPGYAGSRATVILLFQVHFTVWGHNKLSYVKYIDIYQASGSLCVLLMCILFSMPYFLLL